VVHKPIEWCDLIGAWLEAPSLDCPLSDLVRAIPHLSREKGQQMSTLPEVFAGVDTHRDRHAVAVVDPLGKVIGTAMFDATATGYQQIQTWVTSFGRLLAVGVEGTGSYGMGLSRHLKGRGIEVREVIRPNRQHRRRYAKSDVGDAIAAARAVISGEASGSPRGGTGNIESLRVVKLARDSAIKGRTAVANQIHALVVTAPEPLRNQLRGLTINATIDIACRFRAPTRPDTTIHATKHALRSLAQQWRSLSSEISALDDTISYLVTQASQPELLTEPGVGYNTAADLLICVGSHPERIQTEAGFAALCGVSPVDASSGRQQRHRLNRGGDRQANAALHRIIIVRLRHHQPTRDYMTRRLTEGKTKKEIIRCLKRHLARQLYQHLKTTT